ncbi:signal transducer CD24-like [Rhinopithecus roxellana]|uniref:signal transducer CD24-like n=1 Tax=Rhinopithecus roxellana TaxID=61622 RepID=UPI00123740BE|nr:signal transducer CD24-like [Rhinopithecus roxellana]
MGRAMVARLGLGLLVLALLLSTQIYSNETTVVTVSSNTPQSTSTTPNPANATIKAVGGALQSTASLFVVSLSLLHLYLLRDSGQETSSKLPHLLNQIQMVSGSPMWQGKTGLHLIYNSTPFIDTENV